MKNSWNIQETPSHQWLWPLCRRFGSLFQEPAEQASTFFLESKMQGMFSEIRNVTLFTYFSHWSYQTFDLLTCLFSIKFSVLVESLLSRDSCKKWVKVWNTVLRTDFACNQTVLIFTLIQAQEACNHVKILLFTI